MMKKIYFFILIASSVTLVNAQDEDAEAKSKLPTVGIGTGILAYHGDLSKNSDLTDYTKFRPGYHLNIEQRFLSFAGAGLNITYGKLAHAERSPTRNLNFESRIIQADLNIYFHFDNGFVLSQRSSVAPYVGVGFGYLKFDPHTDLTGKNGVKYNYWSDGSIRDQVEADSTLFTSTKMVRDYSYETKLTDPANNYKRSTFSIPLTAGVKFRLSPAFDIRLNGTYFFTMTDYIDNLKNEKNDRYFYTSFGIHYHIGGHYADDEDSRYEGVDFSALAITDTDGDGIIDADDNCQDTPKGVKVNHNGCPKDSDEDGLPDYQDKEPNSPKGSVVNKEGVKISDEELAMLQLMHDSLATERADVFKQNPSLRSLQEIDAKIAASGKNPLKKLPAQFEPADLNKDGIIQSLEITAAIDAFFEGDSEFTVERLHDLIDYFFEQ